MPGPGRPEPVGPSELAPGQRASDRERQAVIDHLRAATGEGRLSLDEFTERVGLVVQARTSGDLVPVTADLPAVDQSTGSDGSEVVPLGDRSTRTRRRRLVSVFGRARHAGVWEAEPAMTVVALFGHSHVDLTACRLPSGVDSIELRTIGVCAGVEVVVPPGAVVGATGFSLFGARQLRHDGLLAEATPCLRVRVSSYGLFGGLLVRSPRRVP